MLQILDKAQEDKLPPILRLAFRPFFLLGALFSVVAMILWLLTLSGMWNFSPYSGVIFWHSHEMLFGFVAAIVIGFLLTAVQNWTGIPGIRGKSLGFLVISWLIPRCLFVINFSLPPYIYLLLDCLFLPVASYFLARPIIAVSQARNLFFVPVLLLLTACNAITHIGAMTDNAELIHQGNIMAVWCIVLLMTVLGGRVIPFFTANGTGQVKVNPIKFLEFLVIGHTLLLFILFATGLYKSLPSHIMASLYALASVSHTIRWLRWRFFSTLKVALLWSLHIGYGFIPLGLAVLAISEIQSQVTFSNALHLLTAGAMGSMILAMMSRVSLGHTGRPLQVNHWISLAFICVILAGLGRGLGNSFLMEHTALFHQSSLILWIAGYGLFVAIYLRILASPRADGRPG